MSTAEAPSLIGDELPAVTLQSSSGKRCCQSSLRKAGLSPASTSTVVDGRTDSSVATSTRSPLTSGALMGTTSRANLPSDHACAARR
ncbi:Uncharacterised protein [Mycobacteroides abscessus subsp. abscessus]|nr:Uncharacterised protein [Mycobacteroides abscessus subsp. abscessus]SKU89791.1 Uncharacterised protein [Mycobacteroides abscessus subsp. abscessus]